MSNEIVYNGNADVLSKKITLPAPAQIAAMEKKCENERGEAIWSVFAAPFTALKELFEYTGQAKKLGRELEGSAVR